MKKSKILGIALAAAMVSSVAVVSVSALEKEEMKDHTVGIVGSFNGWANDGEVPMTDDDGDGIYEGTIVIDSVTKDMIGAQQTDKGPTGGVVETGKVGVQFKVRLDGTWGTSWGDYEEAYDRTENSQTNCCVEATEGEALTIKVKFDTVNALVHDEDMPEEDYKTWPVTYEKVAAEQPTTDPSEEPSEEPSKDEEPSEEPSKDEEPSEEPSKDEEPKEDQSATDTSTTGPASEADKDTTPVATGDTTSAVALVAVVIASLGAAVVMTKKASSKE